MRQALNLISQTVRKYYRRWLAFTLGLVLVGLVSQYSQVGATSATATSSTTNQGISPIVVIFVAIAIIPGVFYIRGMYLVLSYASRTYGLEDDPSSHNESPASTNLLILGSALLVVGSAIIISAYGWASQFLYIGPVLCLLGPLVIIFSMEVDLKRYRQQLVARQLEQQAHRLDQVEREESDTSKALD